MNNTRWGLLGAGWISQRAIVPAMHSASGATLWSVGARDVARAASLGPIGGAQDNYRSVVDDPEVDAIYIALDNAGHLPWIEAALDAGKPVLCEKPLTMNPAQTQRALAWAHDRNGLLVEAAWNLWHPRTQRLLALIRGGAIGVVTSIDAHFTFDTVPHNNYRLDPLRGGGALLDVGCYALMLTAAVIDDDDSEIDVQSVERVVHEGGVDLQTHASLRAAGVQVTMGASFIAPESQSVLIRGSHGSIWLSDPAFTSYLSASTLTCTSAEGTATETFPPVDAYAEMITQVSAAVASRMGHHTTDHWLPDPQWSRWVSTAMGQIAATT